MCFKTTITTAGGRTPFPPHRMGDEPSPLAFELKAVAVAFVTALATGLAKRFLDYVFKPRVPSASIAELRPDQPVCVDGPPVGPAPTPQPQEDHFAYTVSQSNWRRLVKSLAKVFKLRRQWSAIGSRLRDFSSLK